MENDNHVLLQQEVCIYPGRHLHMILLTRTQIVLEKHVKGNNTKNIETINLDDVIGCHLLQEKRKSVHSFLCIFSYPVRKKFMRSSKHRKRVTKTISISSKSTFEENLKIAQLWKRTIKQLIRGVEVAVPVEDDSGTLPMRNLLVLVNPFSGTRQAMRIYRNHVKTMFTEAEIKHTVKKTEYAGHARKIAFEMGLDNYDGIVVISGDGLVHEVLNGLMDRSDWEKAIKTPIGVISGGSGNALAAAAVFQSTELHKVASDPVFCTFEICRGEVSAMDLVGVEFCYENDHLRKKSYDNMNMASACGGTSFRSRNRREIYSFMDMAIGLIADIDIESESLRCFGGDLRNTLYAILLILKMRRVRIRLSYLPFQSVTEPSASVDLDRASGDTIGLRQISEDIENAGVNMLGDHAEVGVFHKVSPKKPSPPPTISRESTLPPLDHDVPDNWIKEENDYMLIMANYITHVAHNALTDRSSKLNDGKIFLHKLPSDQTTRCFLVDVWDKFDEGTGVTEDMKATDGSDTTVTCSAFRIEPIASPSKIITIDGEKVPYGPMQFRILPGIARLMVSRSNMTQRR